MDECLTKPYNAADLSGWLVEGRGHRMNELLMLIEDMFRIKDRGYGSAGQQYEIKEARPLVS